MNWTKTLNKMLLRRGYSVVKTNGMEHVNNKIPIFPTSDLYKAAYLLMQGASIKEVRFARRKEGKEFRLRAKIILGGVSVKATSDYDTNQALVNPRKFAKQRMDLKEIVDRKRRGQGL